jgi:hypothetical protein
VSSTSASSVTGSASATGGGGGENSAGTYGAGGGASATAAVNANGGSGSSTANATGGFGSGSETANATATLTNAAAGSTAQATSESQGVNGSVTTSATAPVSGPATFATALTEANISTPTAGVTLSPGEVYATAELTPGGPAFGLGGFGAESDGSDTSLTYDATADLTFMTAATEDIFLNLTSGVPSGDAFQELVFTYSIDGSTPVVETFMTVAAADAFFNDMSINLGEETAGTQNLVLSYAFTAEGDAPGYVISYNTSGTSLTPTIPEPSTWAMMLIGFASLGYVGWRRATRAKAAAA